MFSTADRYIAKEFLKFFLGALIVFTTLFLVVDMLSNVWDLKTTSTLVWKYFALEIPLILYQMTPVACLMATIFTVSVLSRSMELIALFSVGIGLARATIPILVLTALISIGSFFVSDKLVPLFTKLRNYVYWVDIKKTPSLYYTVKTNKIWYRSKDLIYNIRLLNPEKNLVQGLTIYYFDRNWHLAQLITAEEAHFEGSNWYLKNGAVTLFAEENSFPLSEQFADKTITLDERPNDIQGIDLDSNVMSVNDLRNYIKKNKEAALDTTRYEVAYHGKFSFAFASFVMAFLGIPFSVTRDRSGGFALNVGICLFFVFVYWSLVSVSLSFGNHGTLPPVVAAWAPNALMLSVAVFLLLRLKK